MIPAVHLIKHLGEKHPDMTISSEQKSLDELMEGLQNNTYQYIIFPHKPENAEHLHVEKLMEEHLYFNLPKPHPLADRTELSLSDINGENMIVMPNTGFWEKVIAEKIHSYRYRIISFSHKSSSPLSTYLFYKSAITFPAGRLAGDSIRGNAIFPFGRCRTAS